MHIFQMLVTNAVTGITVFLNSNQSIISMLLAEPGMACALVLITFILVMLGAKMPAYQDHEEKPAKQERPVRGERPNR